MSIIIGDIRILARCFLNCNFSCMRRYGNSLAHSIANFASSLNHFLSNSENILQILLNAWNLDILSPRINIVFYLTKQEPFSTLLPTLPKLCLTRVVSCLWLKESLLKKHFFIFCLKGIFHNFHSHILSLSGKNKLYN